MSHSGSRLALPAAAGGASLAVTMVAAIFFGGDVTVTGSARSVAVPPAAQAAPQVPAADVEAAGSVGAFVPQIVAPPNAPAPPPAQAAPQPQPQPKPAAKPAGQRPGTVRLVKGGTATLIREELGADATLPVPDSLREATWWGTGLDAKTGATVLAGHVNWKGATGPFAELWVARSGDPVSVVDAAGHTWRYRVSAVETVSKHDLPHRAEELFGQAGPHRLVLVTCGGRWVGGPDGYESNRVVIATPE